MWCIEWWWFLRLALPSGQQQPDGATEGGWHTGHAVRREPSLRPIVRSPDDILGNSGNWHLVCSIVKYGLCLSHLSARYAVLCAVSRIKSDVTKIKSLKSPKSPSYERP